MNFEEFNEIVDRTKSQHPVWFGLPSDSPPTEKQIHAAEMELNAIFPEQYRSFLSTYGGGYFGFLVIFSLDENSEWNLIRINADNRHIRSYYLLVSENGVGDFFGFQVNNGKCEPVLSFFDHETQAWCETEFLDLFQFIVKNGLTA